MEFRAFNRRKERLSSRERHPAAALVVKQIIYHEFGEQFFNRISLHLFSRQSLKRLAFRVGAALKSEVTTLKKTFVRMSAPSWIATLWRLNIVAGSINMSLISHAFHDETSKK